MADPNTTPNTLGLSTSVIAGIAVVGAAALLFAIILTYIFVRRRRLGAANDEEKSPNMLHVQAGIPRSYLQDPAAPSARLGRSVSKRNLTPSIILPLPAPPVPAVHPRPPKVSPEPAIHPSGRPMSDVELLAHHQAAGTMPRPFSPHGVTQCVPTHKGHAPRTSSASASFSFSRASIFGTSLRNSHASSLRSESSLASSGPGIASEVLKVRHVFAPLLPDELVLRPNEKVTLLQTLEDGWCIIGRKSPFHAPAPATPTGYAFGQGTSGGEIEIGAVPSWVFEKRAHGAPKPERPMRNASLGVTLLDQGMIDQGEARDGVMSWSNF